MKAQNCTERLCSESEISFGRCEASTFKLRVRERVVPLAGKKISVSVTLEGADEAPFMMGVYKWILMYLRQIEDIGIS